MLQYGIVIWVFVVLALPTAGTAAVAGCARMLDLYALLQHARLMDARATAMEALHDAPCRAAALHVLGAVASLADEATVACLDSVAGDNAEAALPRILGECGHVVALSDIEKAERLFRHAIALDPSHIPAAVDLAHLLCKTARQSEAIELLRGVLRAAVPGHALREHADAAYELGRLLNSRGESDEAAALFRWAVEVAPAHWRALQQLAAHAVHAGSADEGRQLRLRSDLLRELEARHGRQGSPTTWRDVRIRSVAPQRRAHLVGLLNDAMKHTQRQQGDGRTAVDVEVGADGTGRTTGPASDCICEAQWQHFQSRTEPFSGCTVAQRAVDALLHVWHRLHPDLGSKVCTTAMLLSPMVDVPYCNAAGSGGCGGKHRRFPAHRDGTVGGCDGQTHWVRGLWSAGYIPSHPRVRQRACVSATAIPHSRHTQAGAAS